MGPLQELELQQLEYVLHAHYTGHVWNFRISSCESCMGRMISSYVWQEERSEIAYAAERMQGLDEVVQALEFASYEQLTYLSDEQWGFYIELLHSFQLGSSKIRAGMERLQRYIVTGDVPVMTEGSGGIGWL